MSIQSTQDITRDDAITRIREIQILLVSMDFLGLEQTTSEHDIDMEKWVLANPPSQLEIYNLDRFTNKMIEDIIDMPFYRQSIFDNYSVYSG